MCCSSPEYIHTGRFGQISARRYRKREAAPENCPARRLNRYSPPGRRSGRSAERPIRTVQRRLEARRRVGRTRPPGGRRSSRRPSQVSFGFAEREPVRAGRDRLARDLLARRLDDQVGEVHFGRRPSRRRRRCRSCRPAVGERRGFVEGGALVGGDGAAEPADVAAPALLDAPRQAGRRGARVAVRTRTSSLAGPPRTPNPCRRWPPGRRPDSRGRSRGEESSELHERSGGGDGHRGPGREPPQGAAAVGVGSAPRRTRRAGVRGFRHAQRLHALRVRRVGLGRGRRTITGTGSGYEPAGRHVGDRREQHVRHADPCPAATTCRRTTARRTSVAPPLDPLTRLGFPAISSRTTERLSRLVLYGHHAVSR